MLLVALQSWKRNAASLEAHILYGANMPDSFAKDLEATGAIVHRWNLTFMDKLEGANRDHRLQKHMLYKDGNWLREDIHLIIERDRALFGPDVYLGHVLYTDADVWFLRDIDSCSLPHPPIVAMAGEHLKDRPANAGVMVINVTAWAAHYNGLIATLDDPSLKLSGNQAQMFHYFGDRVSFLDPSWNYKPYWAHPGPGEEQPRIMHWHGIKPGPCLTCLLTHRLLGASVVNDRCKPPTCPGVYLTLWGFVTDRGEHYVKSLLHHWQTLQDLRETPSMQFANPYRLRATLGFR